jgi:hypothetical protein
LPRAECRSDALLAIVKQRQVGTEEWGFVARRIAIEPQKAFACAGTLKALGAGLGEGLAGANAHELARVGVEPLHHVGQAARLAFYAAEHRPIHGDLRRNRHCNAVLGLGTAGTRSALSMEFALTQVNRGHLAAAALASDEIDHVIRGRRLSGYFGAEQLGSEKSSGKAAPPRQGRHDEILSLHALARLLSARSYS